MTTTFNVPGREISKSLGIARGNTIRAKHLGKDILAGLRTIVGGEIKEYMEMMTQSREQAIERMIQDAERMGADAIVGVRFTTSQVMTGAAELMAYGTAVKLK